MIADYRIFAGKARRNFRNGLSTHPTAFHCLDVAACTQTILQERRPYLERLTESLEKCDPNALADTLAYMASLHDIGKFTPGFLHQVKEYLPIDLRASLPPQNRAPNHWRATHILMEELDSDLEPLLHTSREARQEWYAAIAGHHGQPPMRPDQQEKRSTLRWTLGVDMARQFVLDAAQLLSPQPLPDGLDEDQARILSWYISGLISMADWIGSNQTWFPYIKNEMPLGAYWNYAQKRAGDACRAAGIGTGRVKSVAGHTWGAVLNMELRPMQSRAASIKIPAGPILALMEDATGSGKTEAAVILAHRMLDQGKAQGIYFALPTMATANAMYPRIRKYISELFEDISHLSVVLAHGRRAVQDGFKEFIRAGYTKAWDTKMDLSSNEPTCAEWVADDARKTFFATVGVGTLDQALMGALPIRYASMRLWGLGNQVIIVDEVHAYDEYMLATLQALLKFHVRAGGSAIIMTATLPADTRRKILNTYSSVAHTDVASPSSLVLASPRAPIRSYVVPALCTHRPTIHVEREPTWESALDYVLEMAAQGYSVAWIRNSVNGALETWSALRARKAEKLTLFHARFALCDRLQIEDYVQKIFGKSSDEAIRAGRILVATQVIEQSLDLDFDCMVSDLAPVDLLIQRAGRLWRHNTRPIRPYRPVLKVVSPDFASVNSTRWLDEALGSSSAAVYAHDIQWRSTEAIFKHGCIQSPDSPRYLIERVYGKEVDLPTGLQEAEIREEGERIGRSSLGQMVSLRVEQGYRNADKFHDEAIYQTRLGEPTRTLALGRQTEDIIQPWSHDCDPRTAWILSDVAMSESRYQKYAEDLAERQVGSVKEKWGRYRRQNVILAPVQAEDRIVDGLFYDRKAGLQYREVT